MGVIQFQQISSLKITKDIIKKYVNKCSVCKSEKKHGYSNGHEWSFTVLPGGTARNFSSARGVHERVGHLPQHAEKADRETRYSFRLFAPRVWWYEILIRVEKNILRNEIGKLVFTFVAVAWIRKWELWRSTMLKNEPSRRKFTKTGWRNVTTSICNNILEYEVNDNFYLFAHFFFRRSTF